MKFAEPLLDRRHRQLGKYGRKLKSLDLAQLHAFRIAAKKQRYATEFFARLYSRKETRRYIETLSDLQDILGIINDVAIVERLLGERTLKEIRTKKIKAMSMRRRNYPGLGRQHGLQVKMRELGRVWKDSVKAQFFGESRSRVIDAAHCAVGMVGFGQRQLADTTVVH